MPILANALSLARPYRHRGGGSSPPPPGYTTGAVSFDGATYLSLASLLATDSENLSYVIWLNNQDSGALNDNIVFVVDPNGLYGSEFDYSTGIEVNPTLTGASGFNAQHVRADPDENVTLEEWTCYMVSISSGASPSAQVFRGDTDLSPDVRWRWNAL